MKKQLLIYITVFLLISCTQKESKEVTQLNQFHPQWMHPNLWIEELEKYTNFPYWFEDSLLAIHQIREIVIKEYFVTIENDTVVGLKNYAPSVIATYRFDEQGQLLQLNKQELNEGVLYLEKEFDFNPSDRTTDCFTTFILKEAIPEAINKSGFSSKNVGAFERMTATKDYLDFYNSETNQHLFYVLDTAMNRAIVIDTMLSPNPKDLIVVPNFKRPIKIYNVENLILESNVLEFEYDSFGNLIQYSYRQKSNKVISKMRYNAQGFINGRQDEIYNDGTLLRTRNYVYQLNKKGQPLLFYETSQDKVQKRVLTFEYR